MKKISEKIKSKYAIRARRHGKHNHARALWRRVLKKKKISSERRSMLTGDFVPTRYHVDAPKKFDLSSDNFDEIVSFLSAIRQNSVIPRRQYGINFKTIQSISPIAALLLTAEIDRWRRVKRTRLRPAELKKWDPTVRRLLNEMGFFEVLEIDNPCLPEDKIFDKDVEFIKFISGNESDGTYAKRLRISLENVAGVINTKIFMYNGLVEAMTNSVTHAYPETRSFPKGLNKRWWMSGSYNKVTGRMFVMVYDQGVGIPTTLPYSRFKEFIFSFLRGFGLDGSDGNLIKAAMRIGNTQTGLQNRGLGLNEMKDFIDRSGRGVLRIISGRGDYLYYSTTREEVKNHKYPLEGTLIAWEIYTKNEDNLQ